MRIVVVVWEIGGAFESKSRERFQGKILRARWKFFHLRIEASRLGAKRADSCEKRRSKAEFANAARCDGSPHGTRMLPLRAEAHTVRAAR
jgi:hypothetical protein